MSSLSVIIRPKSVPNRTIFIKPINEETPSHHFSCDCEMCKAYEKNKLLQLHQNRYQLINQKIASRLQKKIFTFQGKNRTPILPYKKLLKLLLPPNNKIVLRGLDIFITQTLFYKNAQPSLIICNREWDEPVLKKIGKQHKFNTSAVQKLFNDRRRQYNNNLNTLLGRKKKKSQQDLSKKFKKTAKDEKKQAATKNHDAAVMIVYHDESAKLISEHQFILLLQKRKLDPIWMEINYLKNYISIEKQLERTYVLKFKEDQIEIEGLYERSKQLMRVYAENSHLGDKDFISQKEEDEFCQNLKTESPRLYALYTMYKMVSFVEKFHDQKITLLVAKFFMNEEGKLYFENVFKLQMRSLFKYSWNNDLYLKKIEKEEERVFFAKEINAQYCETNAKKVEKTLEEIYQKSKNYYGLSADVSDDEEEKTNNQFYKFLHPQIKHDISDILKDKNMTVQKFKKDFLGYKPVKKPLVRPYTSDMLRVLNETTKVLHTAKPHDYVSIPKRSVSTALSGTSKRKSYFSKHSTAVGTPRTGLF